MTGEPPRRGDVVPNGRGLVASVLGAAAGRRLALFLDFDGTLVDIAPHPDAVVVPERLRQALVGVRAVAHVAVVSGRDAEDVRRRLDVAGVWYSGCHGAEMIAPDGAAWVAPRAADAADAIEQAARGVEARLDVPGAWVEHKRFAASVHHRGVPEPEAVRVRRIVAEVTGDVPGVRLVSARQVVEVRPAARVDKGDAVRAVLAADPGLFPVVFGDDHTDEDAFRAVAHEGVAVVAGAPPRPTWAHRSVEGPAEVVDFLEHVAAALSG